MFRTTFSHAHVAFYFSIFIYSIFNTIYKQIKVKHWPYILKYQEIHEIEAIKMRLSNVYYHQHSSGRSDSSKTFHYEDFYAKSKCGNKQLKVNFW